MTLDAGRSDQPTVDRVSNVLKWALLGAAVLTWPTHPSSAPRSGISWVPGDVLFALGALLMAWAFFIKVRVFLPQATDRLRVRPMGAKPGYDTGRAPE